MSNTTKVLDYVYGRDINPAGVAEPIENMGMENFIKRHTNIKDVLPNLNLGDILASDRMSKDTQKRVDQRSIN